MMKAITVVSLKSNSHIHLYAAECTDDILYDVETAFEELGIEVSVEDVEAIAETLDKGKNYWWNGRLCFEVINVLPA